jgi:hypothetical protein
MELSKTVALTAFIFIVILILTSGDGMGAEPHRKAAPPPRNEASFQRLAPRPTAEPATARPTAAPAPRVRCQIKPVMTEREIAACRTAR